MFNFVKAEETKQTKYELGKWFKEVHKYIKRRYKITFSVGSISSIGKKNMIVRNSDTGLFELDYQITINSIPEGMNINACSEIVEAFITGFDKKKNYAFGNMEFKDQVLTTVCEPFKYIVNFMITIYDEDGNFHIIYRDKSSNELVWALRTDMNYFRERIELVSGKEQWTYLRKCF